MDFLAEKRPATITLILGVVISMVFAALVLRYDQDLRAVIREKMIQRDAAVLTPVAQQEIESEGLGHKTADPGRWLTALLPAARRQGLLAMAIFDAEGLVLEKIPTSQMLLELPDDDFIQLQNGQPLTRYWPHFSLGALLTGGAKEPTPVLEIVLPLRAKNLPEGKDLPDTLIGFVRYHLDARALATELATLDDGVRRQTITTLTVGLGALGLLVGAGYLMLVRAQRTIVERTARLQRANFELTLSAKTSALGQITSHLVHGLQGPVAGLRAAVSARDPASPRDWVAAVSYADQMQVMIQEIVGLLGDRAATTAYEMTGRELAEVIRQRNLPSATAKGVELEVGGDFPTSIDSHRGGLLCLVASNLVQNAIEASQRAGRVVVSFSRDLELVTLLVADKGPGISPQLREHLFEPGRTGRTGGSGLGLAISQLLARQIGASLQLNATGPAGTIFRVTMPINAIAATDPV